MGREKIGREACGNSVAKSEEGARMENDKRKTGRKKEEKHNNEMARDQTQSYCVAGKVGVAFVQTTVLSYQKGCRSCLSYSVMVKQKVGRAEEKGTENRQRQKDGPKERERDKVQEVHGGQERRRDRVQTQRERAEKNDYLIILGAV